VRAPVFEDPPLICGHRGSGRGVVRGLDENTIESHLAAVAAGLRWVETDARLNADHELVVHHDPTVGHGALVSQLETVESDALGLVRVRDLLDALPPLVNVDLEVKSSLEDALRPPGRTTAAAIAELVTSHAAGKRVLVTSFDPSALLVFRERAPGAPYGLLTWSRFPLRKAIPAAVHLGAQVVAPHANSLVHGAERPLAKMIEVAHQAGLQVLAWNVEPGRLDELAEAGVDCMVVDDVPDSLAGTRWAASLTRRGQWDPT
jgi:glycerophosphoryl diester phosphodiesterase